MTDGIMEYAWKCIRENGIRMVNLPAFGCREDVDAFIRISAYMSKKGMEAKRGRVSGMTNEEVSAVFKAIYNVFWMKHRDNLPELSDEAGWDGVVQEAMVLMKKYDCELARGMVAELLLIMDQRMREIQKKGK